MKLLKFLLSIFLVLSGCTYNPKVINKDNINLKESMKNFYQTDCLTDVSGEHFQVKLISISKVQFDDESYDTSYTFYRYQILIAPMLDENILLQDIIITPSNELDEYYNLVLEGRNDVQDYQLGIDQLSISEKKGEEELLAYRIDITMSNAGDDYQMKSNISDELFDEYMKELNIKIKYNNQEETINVQYEDTIYIPNFSLENEERKDLVELHESGSTTSIFAPYDDEFILK